MEPNAVVFALLYGDYYSLHERLLVALSRTIPAQVRIELWCNQICPKSVELIQELGRFQTVFCKDNVPKYRAMRELFGRLKVNHSANEWVIWFDDDAKIVKDNWFDLTLSQLRKRPDACYVGQSWYVHYLPGQEEFVRQSKWYREKPFQRIKGKPAVSFAQGSYWWLRTDLLCELDWPDERLSHNGGDTLLGEAVRQQGKRLFSYSYGVIPNNAPRRGKSERPAGATVDVRM